MKMYNDKDRIGFWLRLYNRLEGETYAVESWPDADSSKPNIDALCRNAAGQTLAIEHTLIEPYSGNKADTADDPAASSGSAQPARGTAYSHSGWTAVVGGPPCEQEEDCSRRSR